MRLIDLNPRWVGAGGEGISDRNGNPVPERHGVGLLFDCPCGCGMRQYVDFVNPLDGGPPHRSDRHAWKRDGESFDDLTLSPSILSVKDHGGCGWHGYITNGEVIPA